MIGLEQFPKAVFPIQCTASTKPPVNPIALSLHLHVRFIFPFGKLVFPIQCTAYASGI
jgi:hypothetical protein